MEDAIKVRKQRAVIGLTPIRPSFPKIGARPQHNIPKTANKTAIMHPLPFYFEREVSVATIICGREKIKIGFFSVYENFLKEAPIKYRMLKGL